MEDRLEEAIHVMRSHAVGQGPALEGAHSDMHSLLSPVHNGGLGGLSPAFPNASLALSNRHPTMVSHLFSSNCDSFVAERDLWWYIPTTWSKQVFVYSFCIFNHVYDIYCHLSTVSTRCLWLHSHTEDVRGSSCSVCAEKNALKLK